MVRTRMFAAFTGAALLLGGCSWFDSREIPTMGQQGAGATGDLSPIAVTPGVSTGTAAGRQIESMRTELIAVQETIRGAGEAMRAGGDAAQTSEDIADAAARTQTLSERAQTTQSTVGANAEDARQLATLQQEIQQTAALLDRMSAAAQGGTVAMSGMEGAGQAGVASAPLPGDQMGAGATATGPGSGLAGGRPFVVIRFNDPGVVYESELQGAIRQALQRSPTIAFDVVAVTPSVAASGDLGTATGTARENAARVMRSMTNMGVPGERVAVTAMSSDTAQGNEVHIYVR